MIQVKSNPDAEIGVLGALIADGNPESLVVKKSMMQLDDFLFYNPDYLELYNFIRNCYEKKQRFDIITIMGMTLSDTLYNTFAHSVHGQLFTGNLLEGYIQELRIQYEARHLMKTLTLALLDARDEPLPCVAIEKIKDGMHAAANISQAGFEQGHTFKEIYEQYQKGVFEGESLLNCGIKQFETIKNCGLITIAGASGVGKTYFSLYFLEQLIRYQQKKQMLFFSLEMKRNDIWDRYLTIKLDKPIEEITDDERAILLADGKVFDHPRIDIDYIETIAHLQNMRQSVSVIVIDYIGLVTTKNKYDREDLKISDITQRLAALAMTLNCVVICLSQVNRDPAKRKKDDRCPYPEDVADSVGSVRSSSLWLGIDRPELYDNSVSNKNLFVVKCRKSRYGNNFEAWFTFNGGRFKERSEPYNNNARTATGGLNELAGEF